MGADLRVVGGTLATAQGTIEAGFAVEDGTIVAIGDEQHLPNAEHTLDVAGNMVLPGVVDPHVHINGFNSIDTYETGTAAAARGGVTTVINFAWQTWTGERERDADGSVWADSGSLLDAIDRQRESASEAYVDYGLHATVTAEDRTVFDEFEAVVEAGVPSFKFFTVYDVGVSNGFLRLAFERLADLDAVAVLHTEDDSVCQALTAERRRTDRGHPTDYPGSRPDYAEAMALSDAVSLATETDCKYYGIHTTSRAAVDELATAREDGTRVRGETCPHFTTLTEDAYAEQGTMALQSPPLRTADDVEAMFESLRDGTLDVVSTDHVASTQAEKTVENWWDCPFGVNSLQTALPVFHDEAINRRGLPYSFLVRVLSRNPAQTFGLPQKGRLAVGADADFVVFDPSETYEISATDNASLADYSIYDGREVTGKVRETYLRGRLVADDTGVVGSPRGEYLARDVPTWDPQGGMA
ncbi:dihydropyrimidinase [Haloarcula mannanilytica]|uniref:Dihydropyrimidinase n=1 Tax=Haloarcula mannanilytica TaxID=2509225 RepID=A0A4C2EQJ6_9EURY|nr:amidohydrolase family protein [Haloarcula mannanilytica]GCF14449.1 dihydropyrimidinase [Haloarcula mannanilytica]